jgi:pimeloyl-ACP methyl ester carboxylesterase
MQQDVAPHKAFARLSTTRRDVWPSRNAAAEKFRASKFYQQWDPRVLEKWIEYGLRDLPTEQYPQLPESKDDTGPPVTLTTTTAQEVYFYLRANYPESRLLQDGESVLQELREAEGLDVPFDMPEGRQLYERLPELRPSVLFIFGSNSEASPADYRADKMTRTGTSFGGSGGAAKGKVHEKLLECGHLVGMEKPAESAAASADFMAAELQRWDEREKKWDEIWASLSRKERVGINDLWKKQLGVEEKSGKKNPKL